MNWFDKYRFYIAGFLILIILVGVGVLLWQRKGNQVGIKSNEVRVDVSGAVNKPGVYSLKSGSIFEDAIQLADGFSENADTERIAKEFNRAEILKDGQKIYIASKNESSQESVAGTKTDNQLSSQEVSGKININTASLGELDTLPGIGPAYAQRIIDYREENGGFESIQEIMEIKGIGEKTFEKIKDLITI